MAKAPPEQGIELPRLRRLVEAAQLGISCGEELARQLLALMREDPPSLRKIDVNAAIVSFAPLVRQAIGQATLRFELGVGQWLCRLDPGQFEAALLNLAINGREAMGGSGALTIRTHPGSNAALAAKPTGAEVVLSISDTGSGMPPGIRRRIFEPFEPVAKLLRPQFRNWLFLHNKAAWRGDRSWASPGVCVYAPVRRPDRSRQRTGLRHHVPAIFAAVLGS